MDDEPDAREIVAAILSEAGAEVITASGGKKASVDRAEETRRIDFGYQHAWRRRLELIRKVRTLSADKAAKCPR